MMEKLLVTVDSIEGDKASLLLRMPEEERPLAVVPLALLPEGVSAGDILSFLQFRDGTDGCCAATGRGAAQAASAEIIDAVR